MLNNQKLMALKASIIRDIVYDEFKQKKKQWNKMAIVVLKKLYDIGNGLFPNIAEQIMKDYNDLSIYPPEKFYCCKTSSSEELLLKCKIVNDKNIHCSVEFSDGTYQFWDIPNVVELTFSSRKYWIVVLRNNLRYYWDVGLKRWEVFRTDCERDMEKIAKY
jgi:hypothetical protein